jgi:hypothetical protein
MFVKNVSASAIKTWLKVKTVAAGVVNLLPYLQIRIFNCYLESSKMMAQNGSRIGGNHRRVEGVKSSKMMAHKMVH